MRFKSVEFNQPGVLLIDVNTGELKEQTAGYHLRLDYCLHKGRDYHLIRGSFVGAISSAWVELEKKGKVTLHRDQGSETLDGIPLPITSSKQLTDHQIENLVCGYLAKGRFVCTNCANKYPLTHPRGISIYPMHILPYSQDCFDCGLTIFAIARKRNNELRMLFEKPVPQEKRGR